MAKAGKNIRAKPVKSRQEKIDDAVEFASTGKRKKIGRKAGKR